MKNNKIIFFAAAACAFLIMCTSAYSVMITSADNKKEIRVKTGDIISITLETQPSTGYSWEIAQLSGVEPYGSRTVESKNETKIVGGVATLHIDFKAVKTGTGVIELKYIRPWEPDAVPAKMYKVVVVVTDK